MCDDVPLARAKGHLGRERIDDMASMLLRTLLATIAAILGAVLGVSLDRKIRSRLPLLLVGATGTLLAVVLCSVLPEAKELLPWGEFLIATASGYAAFYVFDRYVSHLCPACAYSEFDSATLTKLSKTAILLLFALGLHSLLDGVAVVVGDEIVKHDNAGVLFAIACHKIPEGLALTILLLGAGYTRSTTLFWATVIESMTVLGGLLGIWALRDASPTLLGWLFAHVGGGFLFLIAGTLRTFWNNQTQFPTKRLVTVSCLSFLGTATLLFVIHACGS